MDTLESMFFRSVNLASYLRQRIAIRERLRLLKIEFTGSRRRSSPSALSVFNLDLHISVVRDIATGMEGVFDLTSWSCSNHNRLIRPNLPNPDPVAFVNQRTWEKLNRTRALLFRLRYARYLRTFSAFLVTYPPGFFTLFSSFQKPILAVAATRFDYPFSRSKRLRMWFHAKTVQSVESGQLTLVANNKADADYIRFYLGHTVQVVPSLCDYVKSEEINLGAQESPPSPPVFIQGSRFSSELRKTLRDLGVEDVSSRFPSGYSWSDLKSADYVFTVPYNISTMTLFELATLGVSVVIPDDRWLVEMAAEGENGALSELKFPKERSDPAFLDWTVKESGDATGLSWWLSRADFADPQLMPNVTRVSREQLTKDFRPDRVSPSTIASRNKVIEAARTTLIRNFAARVGETS